MSGENGPQDEKLPAPKSVPDIANSGSMAEVTAEVAGEVEGSIIWTDGDFEKQKNAADVEAQGKTAERAGNRKFEAKTRQHLSLIHI